MYHEGNCPECHRNDHKNRALEIPVGFLRHLCQTYHGKDPPRYALLVPVRRNTRRDSYDPEKMYWGNNLDGWRNDFPDLLENTGIFNNFNWLYVGQEGYPRILFFRQLRPDDQADLFSYMGNTRGGSDRSPDGMVCFGFGREHHTTPVLQGNNQEFIIGFIDSEVRTAADHKYVSTYIEPGEL